MKNFTVHVTLGQQYHEDLLVKARDAADAINVARALVHTAPHLALFRNRFANFML